MSTGILKWFLRWILEVLGVQLMGFRGSCLLIGPDPPRPLDRFEQMLSSCVVLVMLVVFKV